MESLFKLLLATALSASAVYIVNVFGFGLWFPVIIGISIGLLASLFVSQLGFLARIVARLLGIAAALGFALLMLAGTIGGGFNLSESNEVIAVALIIIAILGCGFFLFGEPTEGG